MHSNDHPVSTPHPTERLRSIPELADEWRVHRNTIHNLVRRGELHAVRVGSRLRFRTEDIVDYLERRGTGD
jgi:excisionase family DNA binding protein